MLVSVKNLASNAMSYTLAMLEMPHLVWGVSIGLHHASDQIVVPELKEPQCYSPFMGSDMFDLLLERERITVVCVEGDYNPSKAGTPECYDTYWVAAIGHQYSSTVYGPQGDNWGRHFKISADEMSGPTPKLAAMRCYVASKLGDTVDIPEELL